MTKILSSSVPGMSEGKYKAECEDAIKTMLIPLDENEEVVILGLADGAGSAKYAKLGAELALKHFFETTEKYVKEYYELKNLNLEFFPSEELIFSRSVVFDIIAKTRINLENEIGLRKQSLSDYNATLVTLIYVKDKKTNLGYGYSCSIGDSVVLAIQDSIRLHEIMKAEENPEAPLFIKYLTVVPVCKITKGEYVNQTVFFTSNRWKEGLSIEKCTNLSGAVLSSDGLDKIYFSFSQNQVEGETDPLKEWDWVVKPREEYIEKFFIESFKAEFDNSKLESILSNEKLFEVNEDDKSVIIANFQFDDYGNI